MANQRPMVSAGNMRAVLFWTMLALVATATGVLLLPFLPALLWAGVLGVLTWPLMKRFEPRFGRPWASFIVTSLTALILVLPFAGLGTVVGIQVAHFAQRVAEESPNGRAGPSVDQIAEELDAVLQPVLSRIEVSDFTVAKWVQDNRSTLGQTIGRPLWNGVTKIITTLLTLVIGLLTMFFLLRDGDRLLEPTLDLVPLPRDETLRILVRMQETVHAVFIGVLLVSLIQAGVAGVAYWSFGVPAPHLWAIVTFVFCTIPLLGAPIIYVPLALRLFAEGKVPQAVGLLAVGLIVVSQVDNILRPFFIGARAKLHEMAVFFSLLGGVLALGPVGIVAGPVVLTLMLGLIEVIRVHRQLSDPRPA
jgi:predicted PurR-regulated permease PerM